MFSLFVFDPPLASEPDGQWFLGAAEIFFSFYESVSKNFGYDSTTAIYFSGKAPSKVAQALLVGEEEGLKTPRLAITPFRSNAEQKDVEALGGVRVVSLSLALQRHIFPNLQ